MSALRRILLPAATAVLVACSADHEAPSPTSPVTGPELAEARRGAATPASTDPARVAAIEAALRDVGARIEAQVLEQRSDVALPGLWWTGSPADGAMGGEVLFDDRGNKRIGVEWVAGDPRRNGRTDVGYAFAGLFGPPAPPGLTPAEVEGAVDRAMATWGSQSCSEGLEIPKGTLLDWLVFDSDILHAGFTNLPDGVLGATFPFIFTDPITGEPTDIDNDGNPDYAFAIIEYSVNVPWAIDGNIDAETVILHEAGHGLGQAHFGKLFQTVANGRFHFSPRSVMNAGYTGVQQALTGTDRAGHCGLYGAWPHG